ncbi:accessory Sec system translocase SecA2 [Flexithrix dorotheae]|uniref:accessory Sec system translocase SecA2 n=1 Tax=Flexithrix dorotheae TaxID=70993 RepID=UPI0012F8B2EE|nr:accessory Sec system translocase SecA2 [Flexithrix dorotheae]
MVKFPVFTHIKSRLKADFIQTNLKIYEKDLLAIREAENTLKEKSVAEFREIAINFRKAFHLLGETPQTLIKAFALVSEAAFRSLGMRPFDEQIIAALSMSKRQIAEMQTGEGKTLTATMPVYYCALFGKGAHVLTFNDYLAKRDANWMQPVYNLLGISVGYIQESMTTEEKKVAYNQDITYLTAKEAGFDYLRSLLVTDKDEDFRRNPYFALIDEVDSILIDESRIPLVIAGEADNFLEGDFYNISNAVGKLQPETDFQKDEYELNIFLTESGVKKIEAAIGCADIFDGNNKLLLTQVNLALHAHFLLSKDVDYIIRNGAIELVGEFTGRVMDKRRWPFGLQAAIEAKENLRIQQEGKILGKATLQRFVNTYPHLCGMTGTAKSAAEELFTFYNLPVTIIPPHKPNIRIDAEDKIFSNKEIKLQNIITEIRKVNAKGRPILVGTQTVEESEYFAKELIKKGISCEILNAKNDEKEAEIIAKAGMMNAVTISTNMAGRGTDIKLGGELGVEKEKIIQLGGLYVIGTNRFESQRIDDQLRGRAGRQGDPGSSQFFVSLEDDLLQKFGINELVPKKVWAQDCLSGVNLTIVNREVDRVQRIIEGKNFEIKKTLLKYGAFIEMQRQIIYQKRNEFLEGTFESLLKKNEPYSFDRLAQKVGKKALQLAEKQISIAIIDKYWADYLEEIDQLKQEIHLVAIGGLNPFREFQKSTTSLFERYLVEINNQIVEKLGKAEITASGVNLEKEGLKRPTSTWTYLINDNPFGDKLEMILMGNSNIGFAAGAAIWWPLLALYFMVKKWMKK